MIEYAFRLLDLLLRAFIVMLCTGTLHESYDQVPALGYGTSVVVMILVANLISPLYEYSEE